MFSFFSKKPNYTRHEDKVYMRRSVADTALLTDAELLRIQGRSVMLLYFFDATIKRLEPLDKAPIFPSLKAEKILKDLATRSSIRAHTSPVFLFAEHHPSSKLEDAILTEISGIFTDQRPELGFYTALDEPMMQLFGSGKVITLMQQMGMKEDEAISHSIVTRSIHNAQDKIAKKMQTEISAHSQEEWIKLNYPIS